MVTTIAWAQDERPIPPAPTPSAVQGGSPSYSFLYNAGGFCGIGSSISTVASKPSGGCGVGITVMPLPIFLEFGVMAPQANRSYLSGYLSVDGRLPLWHTNRRYLPMFLGGYSRLFETGHALDYGIALATPRFGSEDHSKSFEFELRDYWTFANPSQHNVMLRIGWMVYVSD